MVVRWQLEVWKCNWLKPRPWIVKGGFWICSRLHCWTYHMAVASHCLLWNLIVSCGISLSLVASHCLSWHLIVFRDISLSLNFDWCFSNETPAVNAHAVFLYRSLTRGLCKLLGELFLWAVLLNNDGFVSRYWVDFRTWNTYIFQYSCQSGSAQHGLAQPGPGRVVFIVKSSGGIYIKIEAKLKKNWLSLNHWGRQSPVPPTNTTLGPGPS